MYVYYIHIDWGITEIIRTFFIQHIQNIIVYSSLSSSVQYDIQYFLC